MLQTLAAMRSKSKKKPSLYRLYHPHVVQVSLTGQHCLSVSLSVCLPVA